MQRAEKFCRRLQGMAGPEKIPLKQIVAELGYSIATISKWERGERFLTGRNFELLADYTGQPTCDLLCAHACRCHGGGCLLKKSSRGWRPAAHCLCPAHTAIAR
jgi:hypothetical protein